MKRKAEIWKESQCLIKEDANEGGKDGRTGQGRV